MAKSKILVVEDEVIVARDLAAQLTLLEHEPVGHATSGEEAIALCAALRPDLVLMDIQLAGAMDGIVAAQAIRDQFFIPVVFVSAFAADAVIARAKLTEPYGYILKPFSERELQTAIEMAVYKHQAESKIRESSRQLRALSHRVQEVQEAERRRLAIELHDEIGQSLTAIKINIEFNQRFKKQTPEALNEETLVIVNDVLQQVRRLALALRPPMLDELGLVPAVRWMADQVAGRSGFEVRFQEVEALQPARLSSAVEIACFRIAQEALTNISRHAQARQVDISVFQTPNDFTLTVQDDGCGFDLAAMRERAKGGASLGVLGMEERATLIGAQLEIQSAPGQGSLLRVRCPLDPTQGEA